ncbi:beaten path IIIc [Choristoneura fumiferana]|uniref:beaten path IIIc n=1 Tax=Choristoneura fumiferana TaxID=7141 RepID=UPI003D15B68C
MAFAHRSRALLFALILLYREGASCLELLELRVPAHVPLGTRAALACRWALGPTDVLYSVKWYKDGKEFFRHVPREKEPRRKFPLPGVDVERSSPNGANVTLHPAVLETGGRYRCEVSGERPLFPTVSDHADMTVVALPDHGPTITGSRVRYQIGDRVQVNCTSGRSRPATRLAWYVNGEPAPAAALLPPTQERHEDGLETTSLVLDFKVKPKHFRRGDLKLKCLATIATVYWRSNEESVQGERMKGYARSRELSDASRADRVQAAGNPGAAARALPAVPPLLPAILLLYKPTLLLQNT